MWHGRTPFPAVLVQFATISPELASDPPDHQLFLLGGQLNSASDNFIPQTPEKGKLIPRLQRLLPTAILYSTVTDFARFLGWSTLHSRATAV